METTRLPDFVDEDDLKVVSSDFAARPIAPPAIISGTLIVLGCVSNGLVGLFDSRTQGIAGMSLVIGIGQLCLLLGSMPFMRVMNIFAARAARRGAGTSLFEATKWTVFTLALILDACFLEWAYERVFTPYL